MSRRAWLARAAAAIGVAYGRQDAGPSIETVLGPVRATALGVTLIHEHVLVDFIGAADVSPSRYDADAVVKAALPHLQQARQLGCSTIVECTPAYLGRDPRLLARLSDASGLSILTNTGYYGAAKDKHVPAFAFTETHEQLAARWIREAERGIDGTAIKPAFIKTGVDEAPLSEIDTKLIRAAAVTHRATGLVIASHTGSGAAAMQELDLLDAAGVPPAAFIWVHAQSERDASYHVRAAQRGAWIEFDGISRTSVDRHCDLVLHLKSQQLLGRALVSHDAGWYHVGEPGGGIYRSYDTLFTAFVPALERRGFTAADLRQLLVDNPRRALVRGAEPTRR